MAYQRLAYDDADDADKMSTDCCACADEIGITTAGSGAVSIDIDAALGGAPSIAYAAFPREIRKPEITISEAAALLASRLYLHLD